jgi:hypothetical protein
MIDGKEACIEFYFVPEIERRREVNKPTKNIEMKSLLSIYCLRNSAFYDITGLGTLGPSSCHVNDVQTVGFS